MLFYLYGSVNARVVGVLLENANINEWNMSFNKKNQLISYNVNKLGRKLVKTFVSIVFLYEIATWMLGNHSWLIKDELPSL